MSYVSDGLSGGLICLHSYNVNFVRMVLPEDELDVRIKHTAMHDGNFIVGVTTVNQRGEKVLEGTAEVAQPPTTLLLAMARKSRAWVWICTTPPRLPALSGTLLTRT